MKFLKVVINVLLFLTWLCSVVFLVASTGWLIGLALGAVLFAVMMVIIVTIDP